MSYQERYTWAFGVISIAAYLVYLSTVLPQLGGVPVEQIVYQWPLLASVGGAIVAGILAGIVLAVIQHREGSESDIRDTQIDRFGERMGAAFIIIGAVAAMLFAMMSLPHFWIANVVYLGFVVSALVASIAKIVAYRTGLPSW